MLSNLLSFWRGKHFLTQVLDEFQKMLDKSEFMFTTVCEVLIGGQQSPQIKEKIYAIDREINELERDIRTRIVTHLSMQPAVDIPSCLLFMSVVKDAERLGDYAKNLYEITELHSEPIDLTLYKRYFDELEKDILVLFADTKKIFMESYDSDSRPSWVHDNSTAKRCEAILPVLTKSDLSIPDAVCLTLIARYYKRISAHLGNIATSVLVPISNLDYYDEKKLNDS